MDYGKNNHYENKYGKQLNEWLLATFTYEEMKAWYRLQIIKYLARKGRKSGEPFAKDFNKAMDYAKSLSDLVSENEGISFMPEVYIEAMQERVDNFKEWKGEK